MQNLPYEKEHCEHTLYPEVDLNSCNNFFLVELIVLSDGTKVAPVPIEQMIKAELPVISNAVVIGDQRPYLVCLLTLKVHMQICFWIFETSVMANLWEYL